MLGEGPMWVPQERALWFVDIDGGAVHKYAPDTNTRETFSCGGRPSFIVKAEDGSLLVGSLSRVHRLESGKLGTPVTTIDQAAHNRTNDATVDDKGHLWFGTMDDNHREPSGALYCFQQGKLRNMGCAAVITNGPAVSAHGQILYHVDTYERVIWRYGVIETPDGPRLDNGEVLVRFGVKDGAPDGGWGVHRYAPDGRLLSRVKIACAQMTKIAFGGDDLRTCYVTTARTGLSESELAQQPLAGGLFAFDAPVAGRTLPPVKLLECAAAQADRHT